jgi:cobalt-zinc-cadmium resistance protein CzcA
VLTALAIPVSLLFAAMVMNVFGVSASLLSLGAIDFGIIVDGTLVMVEYLLRRPPPKSTTLPFGLSNRIRLADTRPGSSRKRRATGRLPPA